VPNVKGKCSRKARGKYVRGSIGPSIFLHPLYISAKQKPRWLTGAM